MHIHTHAHIPERAVRLCVGPRSESSSAAEGGVAGRRAGVSCCCLGCAPLCVCKYHARTGRRVTLSIPG